MDLDVEAFAQVAVIIVMMVGSLSIITVASIFFVRRAARATPRRQDDDRLEHLQQSVDAIAVEVERIAEAQRFSAKLLAERTGEPSSPERGAPVAEIRSSLKG